MKSIYLKYKSILNLAIVVSSIAVFNIVANQIFFRVDLSSDQVHSLSPKTKDLLLNLEDIISADVYLDGNFPAEIEKLKKALSENSPGLAILAPRLIAHWQRRSKTTGLP